MSATAGKGGATRLAARIAAVQALYEMEIGGKGVLETLAEFEAHWIGREIDGVELGPTDAGFFRDTLAGVVREQRTLDPRVDAALSEGWPLKRLEAVLRAILRAGAYELSFRRDVPAPVTISSYVDVARAFYDGPEPGMVNAVLDKVARAVRPDEAGRKAWAGS
jgi:N utilization substance protein B